MSETRNVMLAVLRQWLGYCASTACADALEQAGFRTRTPPDASVSEGQPSALRASAPEGIDALRADNARLRKALEWYASDDDGEAADWTVCLPTKDGGYEPVCRFALFIARAQEALATPAPASVEAGPSRSASPPSSPEGIDAAMAGRWAREITRGCEEPHRLDLACAECRPGGRNVQPGFRCAFHEALAYLTSAATAPEGTPG